MNPKEQNQYTEIFLAEAHDQQLELDRLFTELEKHPERKEVIQEIFRITHTLKGNASGMGFEEIATLAHTLEDIFQYAVQGQISFTAKLYQDIFKANDALNGLIQKVRDPAHKVSWRGIQTKLKVFLRKVRENQAETPAQAAPETPTVAETVPPSPAPEVLPSEAPIEQVEMASPTAPFPAEEAKQKPSQISFSEAIQVPVRKLDQMMKLVGELIIERDRILALSEERNSTVKNELAMLHRITSELQYSVMDARMVKAGFLFNKFHRIVRDAAHVEEKDVDLELIGTNQEIDRNILQAISDSLIHLVRNAISHGVEGPEARKAAGKAAVGKITLTARSEQDISIIEVQDDGKGIDPEVIRRKAIEKGLLMPAQAEQMSKDEIIQLIFLPGFSSRDQVSEISGRGVGMDVVARAVSAIGGKVRIETELGTGTKVLLSLPTSMAVKGALLFEIRAITVAIPLSYTESVVTYTPAELHKVGDGLMANFLGRTIPVVFLHDIWDLPPAQLNGNFPPRAFHRTYDLTPSGTPLHTIIVSHEGKWMGLIVDKLLQQKEIVEKKLEKPLESLHLFTGATILGNGAVCMVLDVPAVVEVLYTPHKNWNKDSVRTLEPSTANT